MTIAPPRAHARSVVPVARHRAGRSRRHPGTAAATGNLRLEIQAIARRPDRTTPATLEEEK